MEEIFDILNTGISAVFQWFDTVLNETELYIVILGAVIMLVFWRMIIAPLFGGSFMGHGRGSDRAQDRRSNNRQGNNQAKKSEG